MAGAVGSDALHEMAAVSGVAADWRACRPLPPRPVPDPGQADDARAAVTVPVEVYLGAVHDLPVPAGAARRAGNPWPQLAGHKLGEQAGPGTEQGRRG